MQSGTPGSGMAMFLPQLLLEWARCGWKYGAVVIVFHDTIRGTHHAGSAQKCRDAAPSHSAGDAVNLTSGVSLQPHAHGDEPARIPPFLYGPVVTSNKF